MFDDLDDNPKWCAVALKDLLDVVERNADYDDYCRMLRYTKEFIKTYGTLQVETDKDMTIKLQADIMKAFHIYIEHCNTVYLKTLEEEQSSDEDEVFTKRTTPEEKTPYIPEPFPFPFMQHSITRLTVYFIFYHYMFASAYYNTRYHMVRIFIFLHIYKYDTFYLTSIGRDSLIKKSTIGDSLPNLF